MRDDGSVVRSGDMGCPDAMRAANAILVVEARRERMARALLWLAWLVSMAVLVVSLIVVFDMQQAGAQSRRGCGDRNTMLKALKEGYGEVLTAFAIDTSGAVVEIMVSPGGTWTVLKTYPGQPTCAVAAGTAWESLPAVGAGEPS